MENSKEIAENKLRIERFEKLIASSKSMDEKLRLLFIWFSMIIILSLLLIFSRNSIITFKDKFWTK